MYEKSLSKFQIKKNAYTLIEILVTLSIIGIIFTFGYASYRDFSRRQIIKNEAQLIQGDLRFAQASAIAGQKPSACSSTLESYGFIVASQSEYKIEVFCGGSGITIKDVNLPPDVIMTNPSPNPLEFKVLGQGTNIGSSDWILTLTHGQSGSADSIEITVTPGGEIK